MLLESKIDEGILFVRLTGELDHHAVEKLRDEIEDELRASRESRLVMSFRNIDFMDSSGLGLILGRYKSVSLRGGKMAICEVNGSLRRLFEMSGLLKILPLYESEDEALRAVKEAL